MFVPKVYNKWHETELERWLSDHGAFVPIFFWYACWIQRAKYELIDIPYPTPSDRRNLENLVKANWASNVQQPIGDAADYISDYTSDKYQLSKDWIFDTYVQLGLR